MSCLALHFDRVLHVSHVAQAITVVCVSESEKVRESSLLLCWSCLFTLLILLRNERTHRTHPNIDAVAFHHLIASPRPSRRNLRFNYCATIYFSYLPQISFIPSKQATDGVNCFSFYPLLALRKPTIRTVEKIQSGVMFSPVSPAPRQDSVIESILQYSRARPPPLSDTRVSNCISPTTLGPKHALPLLNP